MTTSACHFLVDKLSKLARMPTGRQPAQGLSNSPPLCLLFVCCTFIKGCRIGFSHLHQDSLKVRQVGGGCDWLRYKQSYAAKRVHTEYASDRCACKHTEYTSDRCVCKYGVTCTPISRPCCYHSGTLSSKAAPPLSNTRCCAGDASWLSGMSYSGSASQVESARTSKFRIFMRSIAACFSACADWHSSS